MEGFTRTRSYAHILLVARGGTRLQSRVLRCMGTLETVSFCGCMIFLLVYQHRWMNWIVGFYLAVSKPYRQLPLTLSSSTLDWYWSLPSFYGFSRIGIHTRKVRKILKSSASLFCCCCVCHVCDTFRRLVEHTNSILTPTSKSIYVAPPEARYFNLFVISVHYVGCSSIYIYICIYM